MGNKAGKVALKSKEVSRLATASGLEETHVKVLYSQFLSLKGVDEGSADLTISLTEFQAALGYRGKEASYFTTRVFKVFDDNNDGHITFEEFLMGVSGLTPTASSERRMRFAFAIYDADKKGYISQLDLKHMLQESFKENDVHISESQMDKLVADTFKTCDADRDGVINLAEFKSMCTMNPNILKPITLNVADVIAQMTAEAASPAAAAAAK